MAAAHPQHSEGLALGDPKPSRRAASGQPSVPLAQILKLPGICRRIVDYGKNSLQLMATSTEARHAVLAQSAGRRRVNQTATSREIMRIPEEPWDEGCGSTWSTYAEFASSVAETCSVAGAMLQMSVGSADILVLGWHGSQIQACAPDADRMIWDVRITGNLGTQFIDNFERNCVSLKHVRELTFHEVPREHIGRIVQAWEAAVTEPLAELESVTFEYTAADGDLLIPRMRRLRKLALKGVVIHSELVTAMAHLDRTLESLTLHNVVFASDRALNEFATLVHRMATLRSVDFAAHEGAWPQAREGFVSLVRILHEGPEVCARLTHVTLSARQLHGGTTGVFRLLGSGQLSSIRELDLSRHSFVNLDTLPVLGTLVSLEVLTLAYVEIDERAADGLCDAVRKLPRLRLLVLPHRHLIARADAMRIAESAGPACSCRSAR